MSGIRIFPNLKSQGRFRSGSIIAWNENRLGVWGKCPDIGWVNKAPSDWKSSKGIARAILYDRASRRKYLGRFLLVTLMWMAVGLWVIDGWLAESALRFLIWWAICGVLAIVLMIFALYDAAAVVREERERR